MQGKLPDVSSAFSFWRAYAVNCLENRNYNGASAGLYNINSLLTEDYVVSIDTDEYHRQTKELVLYHCESCKEKTPLKNISVFDLRLSDIHCVLLGKQYIKAWTCIHCKEDHPLEGTTIEKEKTVSPFYRKVVPECPKRRIGIQDRFSFRPAFDKWFYKFLEELQH